MSSLSHLILDSNTTTYVAKYLIPTNRFLYTSNLPILFLFAKSLSFGPFQLVSAYIFKWFLYLPYTPLFSNAVVGSASTALE